MAMQSTFKHNVLLYETQQEKLKELEKQLDSSKQDVFRRALELLHVYEIKQHKDHAINE